MAIIACLCCRLVLTVINNNFIMKANNELFFFNCTVQNLPDAGSVFIATPVYNSFSSPFYPSGLLPNLNEVWTIKSTKWNVITVRVNIKIILPHYITI